MRGAKSLLVPALTLAAVFGLVPLALSSAGSSYFYQIAGTALTFVILSVSMNLITGTTGLLCLGHAAFYGIGAYTAALLSTTWKLPFLLTLPAGALAAGLAGVLVALPTMRLISIYFAVATLGIGEIISVTLLNWVSLTRGPMGIFGIGPVELWGTRISSKLGIYYVTAAVAVLAVWIIHRLTHSYYGNALRSVREDDQCAAAMGIDVVKLKIQVFGVSTFFAGLAGALMAHSVGYISPDYFKFHESILILAMVVVGGLGSVPGGVVGALLLILLPEATRGLGDWRMLAVGAVMFLSILLLPKGLFGEVGAIDMARRMLGAAWPGPVGPGGAADGEGQVPKAAKVGWR